MEAEDINKDTDKGVPGASSRRDKSQDSDPTFTGADLTPEEIDDLRAEVSKWQERVPKLATALRERTEELAAARDQIRQLSHQSQTQEDGTSVNDARLQARDDVIRDLEAKLASQAAEHRATAGELHSLKLALESAETESSSWKEKWQSVTHSLDDAVAQNASTSTALENQLTRWDEEKQELQTQHAKTLATLQAKADSLQQRNQNLQQTTEMLNTQVESMAGELTRALQEAQQNEQELTARQQALQAAEQDRQTLQAQHDQQTQALQAQHEQQTKTLQAQHDEQTQTLHAELDQQTQTLQAQLDQQNQTLNERLEGLAADLQAAEAAQMQAESQARQATQLAEQVEAESQQTINTMREQAQEQRELLQEELHTLTAQHQQLVGEHTQLQAQRDELQAAQNTWQQAQDDMQARVNRAEQSKHELAVEFHALVETNSQLSAQAEQVAAERADQSALENNLQSLQAVNAGYAAELDRLRADLAEQQQSTNESADPGLQAEVERLTECLAAAQDTQNNREVERRELSEQLSTLQNDNARLKNHLADRSELVQQLEREVQKMQQSLQQTLPDQAAAQHDDLQRRLLESERRVDTFKQHAQILEEKLGNQQHTFEDVERELVEIQDRYAQLNKRAEGEARQALERQAELQSRLEQAQEGAQGYRQRNEALQQTVRSLESVVDKLQGTAAATGRSDELISAENHAPVDIRSTGDSQAELQKRLLILTQEAEDLRCQNQTLAQALEEASRPDDDFTLIRGIGGKLADQLREAGFTTFEQIAELNDDMLSDPEHPLHSFRSRILRDEWIAQARGFAASD